MLLQLLTISLKKPSVHFPLEELVPRPIEPSIGSLPELPHPEWSDRLAVSELFPDLLGSLEHDCAWLAQ